MIKLGAVLIALSCMATVWSFEVDENLVQQLKQIKGYILLFNIHPWLFYQHPLHAITDYVLKKISSPESWLNVDPQMLYDRLFGSTCDRLEALYRANKEAFDDMPTVDEDRTKNLLCRVSLIVRDCKIFREDKFRVLLYPTVNEAITDMLIEQLEAQKRAFGPASFLDQDMIDPSRTPSDDV